MADRVAAGVARKTELLSVESQLAHDEANLIRIESDREIARLRLSLLLGGVPLKPIVEEEARDAFLPPDELTLAAFASREDLKALERQKNAAKERVRMEEASWSPTLSFVGNLYAHREGANKDVDWDTLLEAEFNLFEGGATQTRIAKAGSQLRQSDLALRAKYLDVELEVKEAYAHWKTLADIIAALEIEVASTAESHQLLLEEYRQGLATNLEVQVAQNALLAAQLNLEHEKLERKIASYNLQFAIGERE